MLKEPAYRVQKVKWLGLHPTLLWYIIAFGRTVTLLRLIGLTTGSCSDTIGMVTCRKSLYSFQPMSTT